MKIEASRDHYLSVGTFGPPPPPPPPPRILKWPKSPHHLVLTRLFTRTKSSINQGVGVDACNCMPFTGSAEQSKLSYTGGPHILGFLVSKSNHEMRGSWNAGIMNYEDCFSAKPQNGSKKILKSTFWVFFHEILIFFPIQIIFSSLYSY